MLEFSEGELQENQLEPEDEATYVFKVKNTCTCVRLVEITLSFETRAVPPQSLQATPKTKVIPKLEPGEEVEESVNVITQKALVGDHTVWINATATPELAGNIPQGAISVKVSPD